MSLIDKIELLGQSMDDGLITRETAIQLLVEHSNGKLSERGAWNYLDKHRTVRAEMAARMANIAGLLGAVKDLERAATPE
ncbi:hypothetical protein ACFQ07_04760, partial [Actinomadura adrarensis]